MKLPARTSVACSQTVRVLASQKRKDKQSQEEGEEEEKLEEDEEVDGGIEAIQLEGKAAPEI